MKKINSENLWEFVNNLATNQKVKFKVFYDDDYITEIFWNGNYFEWEESTFTSEAFFNSFYDFVVIEDDDKLEKIEKEELFALDESMTKSSLVAWQKANNGIFKKQIDFLIDHINKIEEEMRK